MIKKTKPMPFWQTVSLEVLAEEQGVSPVEDLDEIAALWPGKDDPQALRQFILRERAERRRG
jgi:hypothetical protein